MLARSAADANQEEIGIFCCGAQVVEFGTVGRDLINDSILDVPMLRTPFLKYRWIYNFGDDTGLLLK